MRSSESYITTQPSFNAAIPHTPAVSTSDISLDNSVSAAVQPEDQKCFFCGNNKHLRSKCPAREATCHKCQKRSLCQGVSRKVSKTECSNKFSNTCFYILKSSCISSEIICDRKCKWSCCGSSFR